MTEGLATALRALQFGGPMVYPLSVLGMLATGITIDRSIVFHECLELPPDLAELVALLALFAFNFFSLMESRALDRIERLGSRVIDHIRLDRENLSRPSAAAESYDCRRTARSDSGGSMNMRRGRLDSRRKRSAR
jgi:hypothetical protein